MNKRVLIAIVIVIIVIISAIGGYYFIESQKTDDRERDWWNDNWSYRKKLNFDNAGQTEALIDFPALVVLSSSNFDYSKAKSDGKDLRFIDADGSTELKYHIEDWDSSGKSFVWVNVPKIDAESNIDYIWMYYGNSDAPDGQDEIGTYDTNYMMVQHLQENSGLRYDSTSNDNDGNPFSGLNQVNTGKIDGAGGFDGNEGFIDCGNDNSLNITDTITIEAWVRLDSLKPGIIASKPGAYYLEINYEYKLVGAIYDESNWYPVIGTTILSADNWYRVVLTFDGYNQRLYLNGNLEGESVHTGSISPFLTNNLYVGKHIFMDDFSKYANSPDGAPTWEFEDYGPYSTQIIENEEFHWSCPVPRNETFAIIKGFEAKDCIAEARVKTTSLTGGAFICPRYDTTEDKYEVVLDTQYSNVVLNKVVENLWTNIATEPLGWTIQNNTWYTLKTQITTEGNTNRIKVWVNDVLYVETTDGDLMDYTWLALLGYDHTDPYEIYFDDVKVYIPFNGTIDEVRISDMARSPNWIKAQYLSENDEFITYGSEET
ncbi:MAG: DUF2341 domain-containing protein [Methanomassiliicoccales archaeon]|nr:MAG: DUF2341 domain-containing protein [Methanomassiliicoccales archaeon]